jgi:drug/metabolite transporter (DMT)-like permease
MAAVITLSILFSGASNTIVLKALYSVWSTDAHGRLMQFHRPGDATLAKFIGIAVAGILGKALLHVVALARRSRDSANCTETVDPSERSYRMKVALTAAPAFFNMLSTGTLSAGLVYLPASIYMILRGSGIIFTALFSMACLGKAMSGLKWVGVGCCLLGITLASLADVSEARVFKGSLTQSITGAALVITSQFFKEA